MKKRTAFILALIMVLCVVLTACGEAAKPAKELVTKDSLIGGYRKKAEQSKGVSYTIAMDMKMTVSMMGQSQSVDANAEMKILSTADAAHIAGTISSTQDGTSGTESVETYSIKSGDGYDVYTKVDEEWYKVHTDDISIKGDVQAVLAMQDTSSMEMTETDSEYIVNGTVPFGEVLSALKNYVSNVSDGIGSIGVGIDLDDLDFSGVQPAKATYHFDKKTQEPTGVDLDMAECFKSIMEQLINQLAGSQLGDSFSGIDLSSFFKIEAEKFTFSLKDIVFDESIKVELPDAAKNATELPAGVIGGEDAFSWEDPEDFYAEELKISIPGNFSEEQSEGYTRTFFDGENLILVLREDKADFDNYADNMDEYLQLVISANSERGIKEAVYENGRPTFEYESSSGGTTYKYYTVVFESDEAYWLVQFACELSKYEAMKPYFNEWADTVMFAH